MLANIYRFLPWVLLSTHYAIPNEVFRTDLTNALYHAGASITLTMTKHPMIGAMWNKTIEPVFIDLIDNLSYSVQQGFVKGLRVDNNRQEEVNSSHESLPQSENVESCQK